MRHQDLKCQIDNSARLDFSTGKGKKISSSIYLQISGDCA